MMRDVGVCGARPGVRVQIRSAAAVEEAGLAGPAGGQGSGPRVTTRSVSD